MLGSRKSLFRIASVVLGLLVLVLAEGLLQVWVPPPLGQAPHPVSTSANGVWKLNPGGLHRLMEELPREDGQLVARPTSTMRRQRFMHDQSFPVVPDPERPRIFCFGGSATLGVPVEAQPHLTWPGRLASHLDKAGLDAEVINLGGASFSTDQVVALVRQALTWGPTALVVYAGNNEFFQHNLKWAEKNRNWRLGMRPVSTLRSMQLLAQALDKGPTSGGAAPDPQQRRAQQELLIQELMEATILEGGLHKGLAWSDGGDMVRTDGYAQQVLAHHKANLDTLATLAQEAGVPLFLVDMPAHLQHPPHLALHKPALGMLGERRFASLMAAGAKASNAGDWPAAIAALTTASEIDPLHAGAHHARGLARLKSGDRSGARRDLSSALNMDMDPERPFTALSDHLRQVSGREGVTRVDLDAHFGLDAAGPKAFGAHLFHDQGHLNAAGYDRVGASVAWALAHATDGGEPALSDTPPN